MKRNGMDQVFNFSAGPAVMPKQVLKEAAKELEDYHGCGMSVMEMSHRSDLFRGILEEAEQNLRVLADIPDTYEVLFLQGGASLQFTMVPMNLLQHGKADYIISGHWAKKAYEEAKLLGDACVIASGEESQFRALPKVEKTMVSKNAEYVYFCENNTIYGTKFWQLPEVEKPLVADVSSCFLSEPIDVTKYGILFAGAQKNIGPAGVTVVIIRKDLMQENVSCNIPTLLRYQTHSNAHSLYHTPSCYNIYMCGKVFAWLLELGGLEAIQHYNQKKAMRFYDFLDHSHIFKGTARREDRSLMNVPFFTGNAKLDALFIKEAERYGLKNLKGHRAVGGMRASFYNAMSIEGVEALITYMHQFEQMYRKQEGFYVSDLLL